MSTIMTQIVRLITLRGGGEGLSGQTVIIYCVATGEEPVSRNFFEG
jgi:hypothetical protein